MELLSKTDLANRWNVTKQVVHNWSKRHNDFPLATVKVDNRGTSLFTEADVQAYERKHNLVSNYVAKEKMTVSEFTAVMQAMNSADCNLVINQMLAIMGENNFIPVFEKALESADIKINPRNKKKHEKAILKEKVQKALLNQKAKKEKGKKID